MAGDDLAALLDRKRELGCPPEAVLDPARASSGSVASAGTSFRPLEASVWPRRSAWQLLMT